MTEQNIIVFISVLLVSITITYGVKLKINSNEIERLESRVEKLEWINEMEGERK